jgi:hypothetical protein
MIRAFYTMVTMLVIYLFVFVLNWPVYKQETR